MKTIRSGGKVMGLIENQPNAYDLFESDGWKLLRVLPRDDGTFYLTNLGGMADKFLSSM
ncbi:hypothetical protein [Staphylococcus hominis]|uniref:hypothetical protein n=1 Tax=Staphylococcus hominis TaxID=1290 RepID=UPI002159ACD4|nr:hypothetical protein [Staphylococcus hominis]